MKATANLHGRSIKRQVKKDSQADLKTRFLEVQRLRLMVRLAECGRFVSAADEEAYADDTGICPNTTEGTEPAAGLH